jgi:hypothetical protein
VGRTLVNEHYCFSATGLQVILVHSPPRVLDRSGRRLVSHVWDKLQSAPLIERLRVSLSRWDEPAHARVPMTGSWTIGSLLSLCSVQTGAKNFGFELHLDWHHFWVGPDRKP